MSNRIGYDHSYIQGYGPGERKRNSKRAKPCAQCCYDFGFAMAKNVDTAASLDYFSSDYTSARDRFRTGAKAKGGRLHELLVGAKGPGGDPLTIDIAWFGSDNPRRAILHSSGLHGVEGFAGSAIQLQLLDSLPSLPVQTALVVVHVLNPFGMAWLRRVNPANVDLNRNCLEGEAYEGAPETYGHCDAFLNPASPPARDFYLLKAQRLVFRHGMSALKQAIAGGQYEFPRGLFFGGKELQPEIALYRGFLERHLGSVESVVAIDVHTGVGKYGRDLLLVDTQHYDAMRRTFGERVCPLEPQRGAAYRVRGGLQTMLFAVFSRAEILFTGQEFGTYNPIKVIHALREENRWHHYGVGSLNHRTKVRLKETFCPSDESWRRGVLARGSELVHQAVQVLIAE